MANASIQLTESAAARLAGLIAEKGNAALKLRARVDGCGCAGFQYLFSLDDAVREGDITVGDAGATLVVDALSYPHLVGSQIDCLEGSGGAHFIVLNPNEEVGCEC
ncbi:iron-sulfur cluster assembly accessory protein [Comamonas sp. NLF-1-9]|uniref:iron-sulfur cluster assembly accessory protein n=1 Tax=Comamonas sp. NLF-1-9 TaxID=2853163 RepID=UPI001C46CBCE|nr:iron-sulfur cluster assembly accessory protein [Comamonas sp. NLF-1-9]QXL83393.1 iron-sulfur cluster assembly accessory protein [Comamonas sp. NLF-1-9]